MLLGDIRPIGEEIRAGEQGHVDLLQLKDQGAVVRRCGAQGRGVRLAFADGCEVFNIGIVGGKGKGVGRVALALQGCNVILGRHLLAVAPVVFPQMEGIGQTVV